jgi:hypothetical protein
MIAAVRTGSLSAGGSDDQWTGSLHPLLGSTC